jgi:predicted nucleotidyltransferase
MRLTPKETQIISETFSQYFSSDDHLWLFGSRVNDTTKGGDIDLYIETHETDANALLEKKLNFVNELWQQLGEQKIDVILNMLSSNTKLPIYLIAKKEGVILK